MLRENGIETLICIYKALKVCNYFFYLFFQSSSLQSSNNNVIITFSGNLCAKQAHSVSILRLQPFE